MENASKALIMAGEILIALIVLGLGIGIIVTMGKFSANMNDRIAADTVAEFNSNFTKFEGRIDITAEEIASIINFAKHSNDERGLSIDDCGTANQSVYWVDIYVKGINIFTDVIGVDDYKNTNAFKSKINRFIRANNETYFYCNVDVSTGNKPEIIEVPEGSKKGKINIKLATTDIQYSLNTKDRTKLITSIQFGATDDRYGINGDTIIKFKPSLTIGMTEEEKNVYAFKVRNDARKMYTYIYD